MMVVQVVAGVLSTVTFVYNCMDKRVKKKLARHSTDEVSVKASAKPKTQISVEGKVTEVN
jgi:hypothetical protein